MTDNTLLFKMYPDALTVGEAAEILRVSSKTIYKLIKEKKIHAVKVGREKRISKKLLIDYLTKGPIPNSNPDVVSSKKTSNNVWTFETSCGIVCVEGKIIDIKGGTNDGEAHAFCKQAI